MADRQNVLEAYEIIGNLLQVNSGELFRRPGFGELHFGQIESDFNSFRSLLSVANNIDLLARLPETALGQLHSSLVRVRDVLHTIGRSSVTDQDFLHRRNKIIEDFSRSIVDEMKNVSWMLLPLLIWSTESDEQKITLKESIKAATSAAQQLTDQQRRLAEFQETYAAEYEARKRDLHEVIESAKAAAGSIGIDSFSNAFGEQAKNLQIQSRKWLIATIITAIVAALTILLSPFLTAILIQLGITLDQDNTLQVAQIVASKVVLATLLVVATLWCGRMYKALKHQESICEHRARALETFKVFWSSGDDPMVKDAVLLEATRSIFALTSPGYLTREDDSSDSSMKVIEIIKSASQTGRPNPTG